MGKLWSSTEVDRGETLGLAERRNDQPWWALMTSFFSVQATNWVAWIMLVSKHPDLGCQSPLALALTPFVARNEGKLPLVCEVLEGISVHPIAMQELDRKTHRKHRGIWGQKENAWFPEVSGGFSMIFPSTHSCHQKGHGEQAQDSLNVFTLAQDRDNYYYGVDELFQPVAREDLWRFYQLRNHETASITGDSCSSREIHSLPWNSQ